MSTHERSGLAIGMSAFAATILVVIGVFQVLARASPRSPRTTRQSTARRPTTGYLLSFDTTSWGWTHILLGIVVFLAGLGVLAGQVWARTVAVVVAAVSAVANFAFIPIYPVWAIVIIALDVLVIWALTAHGRDIAARSID